LVECRSDTTYAERPIALTWDGERLPIIEILARWQTPKAQCFRVITASGQAFQLCYDYMIEDWNIEPI
jgi:hypothetical protein